MKFCVSCHSISNRRLKHKDTGKEYPFCHTCIEKGFYNRDIFDVVMVKDILDIMNIIDEDSSINT